MSLDVLPLIEETIEIEPTPRAVAIGFDPRDGDDAKILVIDQLTGDVKIKLELSDWNEFLPSSAGHRMIEHGWMIRPAEHFVPTTIGGWHRIPGVCWVTFVLPVKEVLG